MESSKVFFWTVAQYRRGSTFSGDSLCKFLYLQSTSPAPNGTNQKHTIDFFWVVATRIFFKFSPRKVGEDEPNLTRPYVSIGVENNHQLPSLKQT